MSFTTTKITGAKHDLIIKIPAQGDTVGANATAELDLAVRGASVLHGLYGIVVDCLDNPNEDVTLRLYDYAGGSPPTVGVTAAHAWFKGHRGRSSEILFPIPIRFTDAQSIAAAVVKGAGGTAGADNPSGVVRVELAIKQDLT